ncbi:hypothetical protein TNCT6_30870 [Streptomyces sp. 6-11-2]|nr:hypothetical protein TNCT6_30870 [Streptomyces sp. 6-11-2]
MAHRLSPRQRGHDGQATASLNGRELSGNSSLFHSAVKYRKTAGQGYFWTVQQREPMPGFPGQVDIATDKGNPTALWPERKIQSVFSVENQDDGGSLTPDQSKAAAEKFANLLCREKPRTS